MIDIVDLQLKKETVVRKRITNFIEKLFDYIGLEFNHDRFKNIVYSEDGYISNMEKRIKMTYDSFMYLIFNRKTALTSDILKTFFYIYFGHLVEGKIVLRITDYYFKIYDMSPIEKALKFHIFVYKELEKYKSEDRLLISLILFNYTLMSRDIPCVQILRKELTKYEELRDKCIRMEDYTELYIFFISVVSNNSFQDKEFYYELKSLCISEIYKEIINKKEEIMDRYKVKKIYLYGSFVKGINRKDSDIDLLVIFNLDLLVEEKDKLKKELKIYLEKIFKRYVDIHEINGYLSSEFMRRTKRVKEII